MITLADIKEVQILTDDEILQFVKNLESDDYVSDYDFAEFE